MKRLVAIAAFCASAGLAQAGETFDSAGSIAGQSKAVIHMIAEGHMAVELVSTQDTFDMAAENHPFSGMSGNCTGASEVMNGAATGGGMCFYKDENGDMAVNRWTVTHVGADGSFNGRWVMVAGSGAMTGITGGGTYKSMTNRETGAQNITLTGAVTLP